MNRSLGPFLEQKNLQHVLNKHILYVFVTIYDARVLLIMFLHKHIDLFISSFGLCTCMSGMQHVC